MKRELNLGPERKIEIETDDEKIKKTITESFFADGLECAHYSLVQDDTLIFSAQLDLDLITEENNKNLLFSLDINHPLYFAFIHLLNGEKELKIQDKNTEEDIKYLSIKDEDDLIILNFVDKKKNEKLNNKFKVEYDNSYSYIKDRKTVMDNEKKKRINNFFLESSILLFEDSHQISFEEYSLRKRIDDKIRLSS